MSDGLRQIQQDFQDYLLGTHTRLKRHVVLPKKETKNARLAVYSYAYFARLIDGLAADFPVLKKLMGDELFAKVGQAYVLAYPSKHYSIGQLGKHLSQFLAHTAAYQKKPWLGEMAVFEWALSKVVEAADAPVLQLENLRTIPQKAWPGLHFTLHPSAEFLTLYWNVADVWQAVTQDQPVPKMQANVEANTWLVWRYELIPYYSILSQEEAWLLRAIKAGENFADLCQGLCQWMDEGQAAEQVVNNLRRWLQEGLLSSVVI